MQNTSSDTQSISSDTQNTTSDTQSISSDTQNASSDTQNTTSDTPNTKLNLKLYPNGLDTTHGHDGRETLWNPWRSASIPDALR